MHLRNVELFCEVVRCHSFSKAAEHREVSQSLVSQAINALEERLGTSLIDRSKRPFEVTSAGRVYYEGCREILEDFREIEDRVQQLGNKVTGRVRVASIHSVSFSEMDAFERKFAEEFPEATLQVEYGHPDEVYARVMEDEADLGLVSFPKAGGDISCIPWLEQELLLVLPPHHRLSSRSAVSVQELNDEEFVAYTSDLKIRRQIDRWLKQEKVSVRVEQQFDNIEHIKRAVEAGVGVALLPGPTVRKELEMKTLQAVPLSDVRWTRPVGIVHKRHKGLSVAAQKFVDLLRKGHGSETRDREANAERFPATAADSAAQSRSGRKSNSRRKAVSRS